MRFFALTALVWAFFTGAAPADPPGAAVRLYMAGDYLAAASAAEANASSSSLIFASRALMAACMTNPDQSAITGWLTRAETSATEALQLDAASVDARVQLALTLGVRARRVSIREAIRRNYAGRGRRLIQEALVRAPDNAQAHALLGAWHLEVLRRGGRTGAVLYGARYEIGIGEFERARALAPDDGMIALHYAIALLQSDAVRNADRVADLLAEAARQRPRDPFETYALRQGARVAAILDQAGPRAADTAAHALFL